MHLAVFIFNTYFPVTAKYFHEIGKVGRAKAIIGLSLIVQVFKAAKYRKHIIYYY